ncbi:hypothetical protein WH87_01925 [Devosia epidermidihirudinis]|uniref:Nudix hydrolase domain-containing protein n=1 Tax=Devosia epidermidihirudinis TaxID=1293439 RepID=A0A0F5QJR3_9HYPH|nr:NUDIX domain-containing protein [Devosia epidermidihirudinis]KKC40938.1 hypothetical protein WH87_01925 [Devosia epidermidihirudinis]
MSERVMISFPIGDTCFNYRVAGAAIRDGHLLVCTEDDDDYCMLPGGRVELGEQSDLALEREVAEELAMPCTIGRLLFSYESFYGRGGERFHEMGLIYAIALPDAVRPNGEQPFLVRFDEGHELHFSWIPIESAALNTVRLLPAWLVERLQTLGDSPEHVIYREDAA